MSVQVRPFRRDDREQLTALVNVHVQAVVPGVSVSVNSVLRQLEREAGEFLVDTWVSERVTMVAEQRGRVVAAAYLCRYRSSADVAENYRDAGEIRWLLCWPDAPFWPDASGAGAALAAAAVGYLRRSGVRRLYADGALPAPGVFGIPEQWPHVRGLLAAAGFIAGSRTEIVLLADLADVRRPPAPPDCRCARTVGGLGTTFTAQRGGADIGMIEVCTLLGDSGRLAGHGGWADVANLCVAPQWRRRGVARWLLGQASEWLQLGHVDRLLDYVAPEETDHLAFARSCGFGELTRTARTWEAPIT